MIEERQVVIPRKDRPELEVFTNLEDREKVQNYMDYYDWVTDISEKFTDPNICCICGEKKFSTREGKPYCRKHYDYLYHHGRIDPIHKYTPNRVFLDNGFAYIEILNQNRVKKYDAKISQADLPRVIDYKWGGDKSKYITSGKIRLHRFILGLDTSDKLLVDHINGDPSDNTRGNLRKANYQQNNQNKHGKPKSATGYRGVRIRKRKDGTIKYNPYINIDGKYKSLGLYDTLEEGIKVRLQGEKDVMHEGFSPQRHLFEDYGVTKPSEDFNKLYIEKPIIPTRAKSGIKNVRENNNKSGISYTAITTIDGKQKNLGAYKYKKDAERAVKEKRNITSECETLEPVSRLTGKTYEATFKKTGEIEIFTSLRAFAEKHNIASPNISSCLSTKSPQKTAKGWSFKVLED